MRAGSAILACLGLLALVGAEIVGSRALHWGAAPMVLGIVAVAVVAVTFLRLPAAPPLAMIFALAGLFWLGVLFGLGSLDPATRQQTHVELRTASGTPRLPGPDILVPGR